MLKLVARYTLFLLVLAGTLIIMMKLYGRAERANLLAYISDREGNEDIFIADVRHRISYNISNHEARDNDLMWSPDGRYLLYASEGQGADLWVFDTSTWHTHTIKRPSVLNRSAWVSDYEIRYLMDGDSDLITFHTLDIRTGEIYIHEEICRAACQWRFAPVVSQLIFEEQNGQDVLISAANQMPPQSPFAVINNPREAFGTLSPDGTQFVFSNNFDGDQELYLAHNEVGSPVRRITISPGQDTLPRWSFDGQQIAFISQREKNPEIYIHNLHSGATFNLTRSAHNDFSHQWAP